MTPTQLHATYQRETGLALSLTIPRMDMWTLFSTRFTEADLILVLRHLKRGIAAGERRPGALKLSNLLFDLDHLEEDLALARAQARRPQATARDKALQALRPTTDTATAGADARPVTQVSEVALNLLRQCKQNL